MGGGVRVLIGFESKKGVENSKEAVPAEVRQKHEGESHQMRKKNGKMTTASEVLDQAEGDGGKRGGPHIKKGRKKGRDTCHVKQNFPCP